MLVRTIGFIGVTVALAATTAAVSQSSSPAVKKAEDEYMNIQVLKGTPADQLIPAMQFISASLGADCEFCHVKGSFEKDDKEPKKTARTMMKMMSAINASNFGGEREVTCFTCHRGVQEVATVPSVDMKVPAETPKPASVPAAAGLLDKYAQAVGGAEALGKVTSLVQKGTMTGPQGRSFPLEVYVKGPGKRAAYVQMAQGMNVTAFDGTRAWRSSPGRPARELSAAETEGARLDADLRFPVNVKKLYKQFEVEAAPKIDGRDVWLVTARNPGQPPLRLYLDASSGLLVRMTRYIETPIGRNPTEIDFQDYRDADGIKLPFKWAIAQPGGRSTYEVTEAKANVPVDDAKFTMPAEAAK